MQYHLIWRETFIAREAGAILTQRRPAKSPAVLDGTRLNTNTK